MFMFVPEDALQVSHDALKYAAVWHEHRVLCFGVSWFDLVSWSPGKNQRLCYGSRSKTFLQIFLDLYPLVIKRGNDQSPINGGVCIGKLSINRGFSIAMFIHSP